MASGYGPLRVAFEQIKDITRKRPRPLSNKQEFFPGSDIVHVELPSATCRTDLASARGFNYVRRHLQPIYYALFAWQFSWVYTYNGSFWTNKSYPPEAILCVELPSAVYGADLVAARGFSQGLRHLQPI
ncbi:hypothetical protein DPMN_190211 [Dreissena polymorpha]|uniref:Uncharacterized protein n=1 Tax=Dreissena polymorpha TaxID=45954 RepID=A0A9D4IBI8_DREPO|nr:hypothetical protein DPMN_190211 [Dreissena polymorpha]